MGLKIKIGNPIKSVSNAVSSAVKNVTNTVERSDIGKVVKVAVQPVSNVNEMRKDIFKGKFESAGNRALGTAGSFNLPTQLINSSSTARGIFERDKFFGSYAQTADAMTKLQSGQSLTADESKIVALTYGKSAAIAGAVAGGAVYGPSALAWIGENAATSTLVGTQLIRGSKTGNYSDAIATIGNSYAPGVGDVTAGLLTPRQPTTGIGGGAGFYDSAPNTTTAGSQSSSKLIMYAVGGVLLILILAIFKKMRS